MATAKVSGQHFLECENCEENPAQYFCKTCPGHLCETCKTEHETKKITKHHEVIHLHRNREETLGLLYCEKHTVNKIEWYCSPCKEAVCTKCLLETHNGHKMEDLAEVLNDIRRKLKEDKEQIEKALLPQYREMLSKEKIKKSEILRRTVEVEKQIQDHAKSIIGKVTMMKEKAIQNLREEGKNAMKSVVEMEHEIESRIETLKRLHEGIINNLGENPGITFFKNTNSKTLQDMHGFPSTVKIKLDSFRPGDFSIREHQFGKSPKFTIMKETNLQAETFSKENEKEKALIQTMEDLELELKTESNWFAQAHIYRKIDKVIDELSVLKRKC